MPDQRCGRCINGYQGGYEIIFHDVRLIILIFFGTIFWFVGISFYVAISDFAGKVWGFTSLTPLGLIFTLLGGGLLTGSILVGILVAWGSFKLNTLLQQGTKDA
ncbi:MAG: hypothetical protein DYG83_15790 [Candidatus Brocadia sp. AMX2]|uniref:hypothetical protein n=1 Tax=Candidatus Brocadia TaxID=380240 RepID=UPI000698D142|nr:MULTISPECIES: hypothetical protein [Brocadia]MBC6933375.1 hypothetical protein [Candidatus Brocadia sp.]MBL1169651.1 hypothetical protein [Candidatus Brocadia sp. AMX1]NOG41596.1 hypothetical protein [Planctomycetota bacterium]KAA0244417.1 MAG: hypothetical protein EDM70_06375 [Candidatus Brocadia sp. AMX2]MCE7868245.1 hypothetical protein [Candidatus Brocadia sp. AMX2]